MRRGNCYWTDIEELHAATGGRFPRERICPQRFDAALAPPAAARAEQRTVDMKLLRSGADWWPAHCDFLLIEGAGGLLSPIAADETVADIAGDLGYPLDRRGAARFGDDQSHAAHARSGRATRICRLPASCSTSRCRRSTTDRWKPTPTIWPGLPMSRYWRHCGTTMRMTLRCWERLIGGIWPAHDKRVAHSLPNRPLAVVLGATGSPIPKYCWTHGSPRQAAAWTTTTMSAPLRSTSGLGRRRYRRSSIIFTLQQPPGGLRISQRGITAEL